MNKPDKLEEEVLEVLRQYDTIILVDDSWSMSLPGSKEGVTRWDEVRIIYSCGLPDSYPFGRREKHWQC